MERFHCVRPRQEVEEIANGVRKSYFTHNSDTRQALFHILEQLKGTVEYVNDDRSETLRFLENEEHDFVIFLPKGSSRGRENFTIAHELGHFFLHRDNGETSFSRQGSNRKEWEANWFAAELLMPKQEFIEAARQNDYNAQSLALHFGVSNSAAKVRAISLGLPDKP